MFVFGWWFFEVACVLPRFGWGFAGLFGFGVAGFLSRLVLCSCASLLFCGSCESCCIQRLIFRIEGSCASVGLVILIVLLVYRPGLTARGFCNAHTHVWLWWPDLTVISSLIVLRERCVVYVEPCLLSGLRLRCLIAYQLFVVLFGYFFLDRVLFILVSVSCKWGLHSCRLVLSCLFRLCFRVVCPVRGDFYWFWRGLI